MILHLILANIPSHQRAAALKFGRRDGNDIFVDAEDLLKPVDPTEAKTYEPQKKKRKNPIKDIPLEKLGDHVKVAIETFGLDNLAKWHEKMTGKKCECPKRQAWLNAFGAELKKYITA